MNRRIKVALKERFPATTGHWWAAKNRVRRRFPRLVRASRWTAGRLDSRVRRAQRLHRWVAEGAELASLTDLSTLRFEPDGVWIRDANGALWTHTLGRGGPVMPWDYAHMHEAAEVALLRDRLRGGGVLIDVGANVGTFAVELARSVPGLRVVAAEPVGATWEALRMNIEKNGVGDRVQPLQIALSDAAGDVVMTADIGACNYVVDGRAGTARTGEERVPQTTVDDLVDRLGLAEVTAIKCDVEGFELRVLAGAVRTLERWSPLLLVEIEERWTRRYAYEPSAIFAFLADHGYRPEPFDGTGGNVLFSAVRR